MRKSLDEHGLRRTEAYPRGDTVKFDESRARQDLASDRCRAIPVFRVTDCTKESLASRTKRRLRLRLRLRSRRAVAPGKCEMRPPGLPLGLRATCEGSERPVLSATKRCLQHLFPRESCRWKGPQICNNQTRMLNDTSPGSGYKRRILSDASAHAHFARLAVQTTLYATPDAPVWQISSGLVVFFGHRRAGRMWLPN